MSYLVPVWHVLLVFKRVLGQSKASPLDFVEEMGLLSDVNPSEHVDLLLPGGEAATP